MKDQFLLKKIIKFVLFFLLLAWFIILYVQPVTIANNDLGRHLANGREIINFLSSPHQETNIFNSNFYSYTSPDFYFVNHHWLSGLVFYLIWSSLGFVGLGVFALFINLATFSIFYMIALKESSIKISSAIAFFMIPLLATRHEIRPEIFSYLFLGLIFYILNNYKKNNGNDKKIYLVPLIILLFVNTHIYFIFGFFIIGLFIIDGIIFKKDNLKYTKKLTVIMFLSLLSGMINPLGYKTLLYPFNIFKGYEIKVLENYSIFEISKTQFNTGDVFIFIISFCAYIFLFIISMYKNYNKKLWLNSIIVFTFGILSFLMIRNIAICALFLIISLSENITNILKNIDYKPIGLEKKYYTGLLAIAIIIYGFVLPIKKESNVLNFSQLSEVDEASSFIISNNISGPMFNNFNPGGYVIFNFYPFIRPFTDNRPEAYPTYFQKNQGTLLFNDEKIWSETVSQYDFNFIFLGNYDYKSSFINRRMNDKNWVKVFENKYHMIFLRNNVKNQAIIEKYKGGYTNI